MKENEEGVLNPLVKILKYQEYCEWILKKDVKDAYLIMCTNGLCWYHEGLIEKPHSIVIEMCLNRVVEVSVASHEVLKVNGEEANEIEHAQVLNLSDDGERWEGDVLHGIPYGWGVYFNDEGERVFEGFRIGEVSVCYGTWYYSDIGMIEYEGEMCEGKRWGRGVQYDRNGIALFDGEWIYDDNQIEERVVLDEENQFLHSHIEELIVSDNSCNGREWSVLNLTPMPNLRLLEVGDDCFENVKEVKLIGLNLLEGLVIGVNCFGKRNNGDGNDPNSHFYLKNCEKLRELKIGCYSFSCYSVCEIENVPSLEVIEMGELNGDSDNFYYASLELKSNFDEME